MNKYMGLQWSNLKQRFSPLYVLIAVVYWFVLARIFQFSSPHFLFSRLDHPTEVLSYYFINPFFWIIAIVLFLVTILFMEWYYGRTMLAEAKNLGLPIIALPVVIFCLALFLYWIVTALWWACIFLGYCKLKLIPF